MKRTLWALCAVLGLAFIGLAPSKAQAAVTCSPQTMVGFTHTILYTCTGVTSTDLADAKQAFSVLKPNSADTMHLDDGNHVFYMFANDTEYQPYTVVNPALPYKAPPANAQANTWSDTSTSPSKWYTVIFMNKLITASTKHTQNAVNHEAGHHFDRFYSSVVNGAESTSEVGTVFGVKTTGAQITVGGGSPYVLHNKIKLTISLLDARRYLAGTTTPNPYFNTYTDAFGPTVYSFEKELTVAGETPQSIAAWFVSQINGYPSLVSKGIAAIPTSPTASATFYIHSTGQYVVKYEKAYTPASGATFTFSQFFEHDWSEFINSTDVKCAASGSIWGGYQDSFGNYICAGAGGLGTVLNISYGGLDNGQIALRAWGYFYGVDPSTGILRFSELWAEQTARLTNESQGIPMSPDAPLINHFSCSRTLASILQQTGVLPGEGSYQNPCKGL